MFYLTLLISLFSITYGISPENEFIQPGLYSPGLTAFVNAFLQLVQDSDDLRYALSQAVKEAGNHDAVYQTMITSAMKYGASDPQFIAKSIADAVYSAGNKLTLFNGAKLIALSLGQTLEDHQLVTTANAAELATLLKNSILDDQRYAEPFPAPYIKALADGCLEVIKILNIQSPKTTKDFTRYLVKDFNEFFST